MRILEELNRRNVIRAAFAYGAVGWVVVQVAQMLVDVLHLPEWLPALALVIGLLGLPLVLGFAWAFELTDKGLRRDAQVASDSVTRVHAARRLDQLTIAAVFAGALLLIGVRLYPGAETASDAPRATDAAPAGRQAQQAPTAAKLALGERSIAVLPFDNLSGDPQQAWFADGMTEDLITDLAKLTGVEVIARNSSWVYKGRAVNVQQVAAELGVRFVLEGSVRREGDRVRVNAQLIDARGGQHLWAERYDGVMTDVFALQDTMIRKIVAALALELSGAERARIEQVGTRSSAAYDAVLQGWSEYRQGGEAGTQAAIAHFERAVQLDPAYARAWSGLAAASWRVAGSAWKSGTQGGSQHAFDRAIESIARARAQDDPLALAVSAEVLARQGRYAEAFSDLERALALAPNDAELYLSRARVLNATGRAPEAEPAVHRAMQLDPHYAPDSVRVLAIAVFHQQRYAEALALLEQLIRLQPDVPDDYATLIACLGQLGERERAAPIIRRYDEITLAAGVNALTVQMTGNWWWYGDLYDYDPVYRDRFAEGLRKAGVQEGAGTDIPFAEYRALLHKQQGEYTVEGSTRIDVATAHALHERGAKFIDVRAAVDFARGHVPGAFNLDAATVLSRETLAAIARPDEEVVFACHGSHCTDSTYATAKAVKWGYKQVYYFAGGFPAWQDAKLPVKVGRD